MATVDCRRASFGTRITSKEGEIRSAAGESGKWCGRPPSSDWVDLRPRHERILSRSGPTSAVQHTPHSPSAIAEEEVYQEGQNGQTEQVSS